MSEKPLTYYLLGAVAVVALVSGTILIFIAAPDATNPAWNAPKATLGGQAILGALLLGAFATIIGLLSDIRSGQQSTRQPPADPRPSLPKDCPDCGKRSSAIATTCQYCGHRFV